MFGAFANIAKIPDLRRKSLITLGLLVFVRLGVFIPLPGVNLEAVAGYVGNTKGTGFGEFLGILDMFSGGGLKNMSIFALGIMPYISAQIIFQLLTAIVPALQKVSKDGESGRRKITQWTRYSGIGLCLVQAAFICSTLTSQQFGNVPLVRVNSFFGFLLPASIILTASTAFLMWLGEQIDEFGLGNGISLIIQVNICARLPAAFEEIVRRFDPALDATDASKIGPSQVFMLIFLFVLMVMAVVFVTEATRKIPMQTSRRAGNVGFKQQHHLPLKLNSSGVIAIIFAQSLMMIPMLMGSVRVEWWQRVMSFFVTGSFLYITVDLFLIIFFSYFYTAVMFDPKEHAENFKQYGMFIPGIRPGNDTREYLEKVMNRITLAGAIFIAIIAIVPQIIQNSLNVSYTISDFFGGTGLLIVVGVALDMVQRIESHMLMQNYEGFLKGNARIRGRKG